MKQQSITAQRFVDIINFEMEMPQNAVWVRNEDKVIPADKGLYIIVGMNNSFTISNNVYVEYKTVNTKTVPYQISQLQQQENIQIEVVSRGNLGRQRVQEVLMALQSIYAQQVMEKFSFKIFRIPRSFVDASTAEGGSMINRYSITFASMVGYCKEKQLVSPYGDYYNDFHQRVDDEKSIGTDDPIVEFEINQEGIL